MFDASSPVIISGAILIYLCARRLAAGFLMGLHFYADFMMAPIFLRDAERPFPGPALDDMSIYQGAWLDGCRDVTCWAA